MSRFGVLAVVRSLLLTSPGLSLGRLVLEWKKLKQ